MMEHHTGFEPVPPAWKAEMLTITPMVPIRDVERKLFKWISSLLDFNAPLI